MVTKEQVWALMEEVFDPEVPVLTIVDLGVVREIEPLENDGWKITITPTYSGCPAMKRIEDDIREKLREHGINHVEVKNVLSPAWTTDWLSENGRRKLQEYGIAPPVDEIDKSVLFAEPPTVPCPRCLSTHTKMISQFGSTACKAHYQCQDCLEPFDYFKCLK
jgi:ring-1,2-phenylacetyl-CoA epoxidase subunit PaaD